jgi:hypothetical protein
MLDAINFLSKTMSFLKDLALPMQLILLQPFHTREKEISISAEAEQHFLSI